AVAGGLGVRVERRRAPQALRGDVGDERFVLGIQAEPGRGHGKAFPVRAEHRSRGGDDEKACPVQRRVEYHVVDVTEGLAVRVEDLIVLETLGRHQRKHGCAPRARGLEEASCVPRLPADRRRGTLSLHASLKRTKEKAVTTTASDAGTDAERLEAPTVEQLKERAHRRVDQATAGVAEAEREIRRAAAEAADR